MRYWKLDFGLIQRGSSYVPRAGHAGIQDSCNHSYCKPDPTLLTTDAAIPKRNAVRPAQKCVYVYGAGGLVQETSEGKEELFFLTPL